MKGRAITNRFTAPPELLEAWQATGGQIIFAEPAATPPAPEAPQGVPTGSVGMSRQGSFAGEVREGQVQSPHPVAAAGGAPPPAAAAAGGGTTPVCLASPGDGLTGEVQKGPKRDRKQADMTDGAAEVVGEDALGKKRRVSKKAAEQQQQQQEQEQAGEVEAAAELQAAAADVVMGAEQAAETAETLAPGQDEVGIISPAPAAAAAGGTAAAPSGSSAGGFRSLFEQPPSSVGAVDSHMTAAGEAGEVAEEVESRALTAEEEAIMARGWAAITKSGGQLTLVARQRAQVLFEHLLIQGWLLKKVRELEDMPKGTGLTYQQVGEAPQSY